MLDSKSLDLMKRMMEAFGPSGFEREVNALCKDYMKPFSDDVIVDKLGTVTFVSKGNSDEPRVLLAGHTDEIGFIVSSVSKEGYLTFKTLGGWWSQVLLGQRKFDLLVRLDEPFREDLQAVKRLSLETPQGGSIALGTVAQLQKSDGPNTINREQAQRRCFVERGFNVVGIADQGAEHLIPAADSNHRAAVAGIVLDGFCQSLIVQPVQIGHGAFGSGQDHGIRVAQGFGRIHIAQADSWLGFERVKIVKVGGTR